MIFGPYDLKNFLIFFQKVYSLYILIQQMFHNFMIFLVYQLGTMVGLNCIQFSWKIPKICNLTELCRVLMITYPIQIRSLDLTDFSAFEVFSKNVHVRLGHLICAFEVFSCGL